MRLVLIIALAFTFTGCRSPRRPPAPAPHPGAAPAWTNAAPYADGRAPSW